MSGTKSIDNATFALGLALLLFLHLWRGGEFPGLHFDEAWAMNYSHRIAFEPGFWPWAAMSPYTAPWAHYWGALWLKLLSPSLAVFRASQVVLALAGVSLAAWALRDAGFRRASALFPLVAALLPGLVMNQRFAVELTGLHVLCLGAFLLAVVKNKPWLAAAALLVGTTAHVLFYSLLLGLAFVWWMEGTRLSPSARAAAVVTLVALFVFFVKVLLQVPEKGKALALCVSALALLAAMYVPWRPTNIVARIWPVLIAISAVFVVNVLFFVEGEWYLAVQTGVGVYRGASVISLTVFCLGAGYLLWLVRSEIPPRVLRWVVVSLLVAGAMMLKPAPRYYSVFFLLLAMTLACAVAAFPWRIRTLTLLVLAMHAIALYLPYFSRTPMEASVSFLHWKDNSRDFLSKQKLARFLGGSGCGLSDIKQADSRVIEALIALSRADWPVAMEKNCPWRPLRVERRASMAKLPKQPSFIADFWIWEKD